MLNLIFLPKAGETKNCMQTMNMLIIGSQNPWTTAERCTTVLRKFMRNTARSLHLCVGYEGAEASRHGMHKY